MKNVKQKKTSEVVVISKVVTSTVDVETMEQETKKFEERQKSNMKDKKDEAKEVNSKKEEVREDEKNDLKEDFEIKDGIIVKNGRWYCPYTKDYGNICDLHYSDKGALKGHVKKVHDINALLIKKGKKGAKKSESKIIDETLKNNKREIKENLKVGSFIVHEVLQGIVVPEKGSPEIRDLMKEIGKNAIKMKKNFNIKEFSENNIDLIQKLKKIKEDQGEGRKKLLDYAKETEFGKQLDENVKVKEKENIIIDLIAVKNKNCDDLLEFLLDSGVSDSVVEILMKEKINGETFLLLTHPVLRDIQINLSERLKIMKLIEQYKKI